MQTQRSSPHADWHACLPSPSVVAHHGWPTARIRRGRSAHHPTTNDSIFSLSSGRDYGCFVRNVAVVPAGLVMVGGCSLQISLPSPLSSALLVERALPVTKGDLHLTPSRSDSSPPFSLCFVFLSSYCVLSSGSWVIIRSAKFSDIVEPLIGVNCNRDTLAASLDIRCLSRLLHHTLHPHIVIEGRIRLASGTFGHHDGRIPSRNGQMPTSATGARNEA